MKTLYFDCFSGISGDMTIGALIDLGLDFEYLKAEIAKLPIEGVELTRSTVARANIAATKFDVRVGGETDFEHAPAHNPYAADDAGAEPHAHGHRHDHDHPHDHAHHSHATEGRGARPEPEAAHASGHAHEHRTASEISRMIQDSRLARGVRDRACRIFEKLAISEGQVHRVPPAEVMFHEVGALDSIVNVVGTAIGLEALEIGRVLCSAINVGGGFIHCQHGIYPVPTPATANLLAHAPVYSRHVQKELVTPTGAAILAASVDRFGPLDAFEIERVGYGAGTMDFGAFPNCLRLFLGRETGREAAGDPGAEVVVIEANIDDMSAEQLAYAGESLLAAGALDVVTIPVLMKKGRPGHVLQVMSPPGQEERLARRIFEETTTIGLRLRPAARRVLDREVVRVETAYGEIRVKIARLEGRVVTVSPEYEDCARRARETGLPFHHIRDAAAAAYRQGIEEPSGNPKSDG